MVCLPSAFGKAWDRMSFPDPPKPGGEECNMPPIRLREGLAFPRDVPRKSQDFLQADGRHTILFKVRGTGLAVYFPCLPARCGKAWVFLPARCFQFIMEDTATATTCYNSSDVYFKKKMCCTRSLRPAIYFYLKSPNLLIFEGMKISQPLTKLSQ